MTWVLCKAIDGKTEVLVNTHWVQSILPHGQTVIIYESGMRESVHGDCYKDLRAALLGKKPVAKRSARK